MASIRHESDPHGVPDSREIGGVGSNDGLVLGSFARFGGDHERWQSRRTDQRRRRTRKDGGR